MAQFTYVKKSHTKSTLTLSPGHQQSQNKFSWSLFSTNFISGLGSARFGKLLHHCGRPGGGLYYSHSSLAWVVLMKQRGDQTEIMLLRPCVITPAFNYVDIWLGRASIPQKFRESYRTSISFTPAHTHKCISTVKVGLRYTLTRQYQLFCTETVHCQHVVPILHLNCHHTYCWFDCVIRQTYKYLKCLVRVKNFWNNI